VLTILFGVAESRSLSGIPIEKLRRHKKQSEKGLRIMREQQDQKYGGSWFWWLFGLGVFLVCAALLITNLF